jgi:hypothetical protein
MFVSTSFNIEFSNFWTPTINTFRNYAYVIPQIFSVMLYKQTNHNKFFIQTVSFFTGESDTDHFNTLLDTSFVWKTDDINTLRRYQQQILVSKVCL